MMDSMKRRQLPGYDHPLAIALSYTMLACATIHLTISLFMTALTGDPYYVNMMHILSIDLLFPSTIDTNILGLGGVILMVVIWLFFVFMIHRHNRPMDLGNARRQ